MSRLVLIKDNQTLAEYNLSKERFTIGRLTDNDLRIDQPIVSSHHAVVINILNDSFIEDLNSTNGTYVNGRLIKKHALQQGDLITIGHHQMRFIDSHLDALTSDDFSQTVVISPTSKNINDLQTDNSPQEKNLPQGKLHILSGALTGRELNLEKPVTTLGRQNTQVAVISRRADGFFIIHSDSSTSNYPIVNGQSIELEARKLCNRDVIEVAGIKMGFLEL